MPVRGYLKRKSVQTKLWSIQLNLPGGSVGVVVVVVVVDGVVGSIVVIVIIALVIVVAVEDMQTVYNI